MKKNALWVIGLSGTNGSGKDTLGQMLDNYHDYLFISVTELLRHEARRRGLPVERETLRTISAEWRREFGLGVLVDRAVAEFESRDAHYCGLVMSSIRNPGEADRIHELGGKMIWIDAAPEIRYARVQKNMGARNRKSEDTKTFEQFIAEEKAEMTTSDKDKATLSLAAVKEKCDIIIDNSSGDLGQLRTKAERALGLS